jgi:hypothetical protein
MWLSGPVILPKDEVIRFCLEVAEENMRQARGEPVEPKTITEIAAWFRQLLQLSRVKIDLKGTLRENL